jgi:hypothetical protein
VFVVVTLAGLKLYKNQGAVNSGWASKDNLKKFASQISGLDTQKFDSCLDSGKYMSLVQNDLAFATSFGFQGIHISNTLVPPFPVVVSLLGCFYLLISWESIFLISYAEERKLL